MVGSRTRIKRVHVMGAAGAGVTTLGRALSHALESVHLDTDDFYWLPTEPLYSSKRSVEERLLLLQQAFERAAATGWVLSGALNTWGHSLEPHFDQVIFVNTPTELRIKRLRERESARFGMSIAPGGPRHAEHESFIEWASLYEEGTRVGRNRVTHEAWLTQVSCPVLRLDGTAPAEVLLQQVMNALE